MNFDALVEGPTDEAAARRILTEAGHSFGVCFGRRGCKFIGEKIAGYSQRARFGAPLLTMVDFMDFASECPPTLATLLLPQRPDLLILSVVVRELESWILADRTGIANHLGISVAAVPRDPENLSDPKQALINLARRSRKRLVREALVPAPGASASVGPGYTPEIQKFLIGPWDIGRARAVAPSLDRCLSRLEALP